MKHLWFLFILKSYIQYCNFSLCFPLSFFLFFSTIPSFSILIVIMLVHNLKSNLLHHVMSKQLQFPSMCPINILSLAFPRHILVSIIVAQKPLMADSIKYHFKSLTKLSNYIYPTFVSSMTSYKLSALVSSI